jgi:Co/Zn/Cd efflux system component
MEKTVFHIKEMDCPSEEQLIRMKLSDILSIKSLTFDLKNRKLTIFHENELYRIKIAIDSLNLGSNLLETENYLDENLDTTSNKIDTKLLWIILLINFLFFIIEILFGFFSNSMGLVADSLDMLADAFVYGLSLHAIKGTLIIKKRIAKISGIFQLLLSILGFIEVIRRFIGFENIPNSHTMVIVSFFALIANSISLIILNKSKSDEIHIKSSQIFTSNDVIANIGVIIAGVLVYFLNSRIPDLVIGAVVFLFVLKGSIRILKLSKS